MNSTPKASPASLCPIPRRGLQGAAAPILYICLLLSSLLVGVGVTQLTTSAETILTGLAEPFSAVAILLLVIYLWRAARTAKAAIPLLVVLGKNAKQKLATVAHAGKITNQSRTENKSFFVLNFTLSNIS